MRHEEDIDNRPGGADDDEQLLGRHERRRPVGQLTITVPVSVINHVLALAHLGAMEYIGAKHLEAAHRDINVVVDEVRSAEKGYE